MTKSKKDLEILKSQMDVERSSFLSHWKTLGDYILPRRPRFNTTDINRGDRRNLNIIDSTATLASRTLRSGMMAGVTSPARPWFRLTTPDPAMAEFGAVKDWLHVVSQRMTTVFLKSNLYNTLPIVYGDLGTFGTAAMIIEEDFEDVMRTSAQPIGSYYIANNERGKVDVFFREFKMTVRQVVSKFAQKDLRTGEIIWDNMSDFVKNQYDLGQLESWVDVSHVIQPNSEFDPMKTESKYKRYVSIYYETGGHTPGALSYPFGEGAYGDNKFLRESGYDFFPVLCPRWEITGEDTYGTDCPGMTALGDVKALQIMHKRKAQAIEKMVNPPLSGPSALRHQKVSLLPGDITYTDTREGMSGLRPIHETNPRIQELVMDIQEHQGRIRRAYYEDLFLMLSTTDRRDITAREIEERHQEKLLALGPVLEQINQDLLDPLIDNTFNFMARQDMIPPPPEEIQGTDLKVEYISIMAQAQKLIGIGSIERFTGFVSQLAAVDPSVLDKVNMDQTVDEYGEATGVPPGMVRSDDEVDALRQERAKAQQAQKMMEGMKTLTEGAKDLSQMDMSKDTALTRMVNDANAGALVPQT